MDETDFEKKSIDIQNKYLNAKKKEDFDKIIKEFKLKMLKNGKFVSPLQLKLCAKKALIRMAYFEPEDVFDYNSFIKSTNTSP
tara:strand:+ start:4373 stop:4621 length:249 start_codon:yes stop_codon:yes gene_type:complete